VRELILMCLRLGFTAFGGPAAHIAMLHNEVVVRRHWLGEQEFLDLLGATNLIPGPNSTEMVIHIGYKRSGWLGLLVAGFCFIAPAMLIVLALAWLYVHYGSTPQASWLLYGIKPVVIALIAQALWNLGRSAIKNIWLAGLGVVLVMLYFFGINEMVLLFGGALAVMMIQAIRSKFPLTLKVFILPMVTFAAPVLVPFSLPVLFLSFLKIGAILYGSGYVLVTFLHAEFVESLGWLTNQQLLDAIAIGQVTPGPVFTAATFIGYLLGGVSGGLVATLGIFLPSFIFVWITAPFIPRLRNSPWASAFLDGVNIAALSLMAAVLWQLAGSSFVDIPSVFIGLSAAVLLFHTRMNSTWLVLGGAAAGLAVSFFP
jgi:chromate transporter